MFEKVGIRILISRNILSKEYFFRCRSKFAGGLLKLFHFPTGTSLGVISRIRKNCCEAWNFTSLMQYFHTYAIVHCTDGINRWFRRGTSYLVVDTCVYVTFENIFVSGFIWHEFGHRSSFFHIARA